MAPDFGNEIQEEELWSRLMAHPSGATPPTPPQSSPAEIDDDEDSLWQQLMSRPITPPPAPEEPSFWDKVTGLFGGEQPQAAQEAPPQAPPPAPLTPPGPRQEDMQSSDAEQRFAASLPEMGQPTGLDQSVPMGQAAPPQTPLPINIPSQGEMQASAKSMAQPPFQMGWDEWEANKNLGTIAPGPAAQGLPPEQAGFAPEPVTPLGPTVPVADTIKLKDMLAEEEQNRIYGGGAPQHPFIRVPADLAVGGLGVASSTMRAMEWTLESDRAKQAADYLNQLSTAIGPENPEFLDRAIQGFGSSILFYVPGWAVGKGASVLGHVSPRLASYLGAGTMGGLESFSEAGSAYEQTLQQTGGDTEKAGKAATMTFWLNLPVTTLTDKIGFFDEARVASLGAKTGVRMGAEATQEAAQEAIPQYAEKRQGLRAEYDPAAILEAGAIGGLAALPFGAVDVATEARRLGKQEAAQKGAEARAFAEGAPLPVTKPYTPQEVADTIAAMEAKDDRQNVEGVQGQERVGEEPVERPVVAPSEEAAPAGGVLQAQGEEVAQEAAPPVEKMDTPAVVESLIAADEETDIAPLFEQFDRTTKIPGGMETRQAALGTILRESGASEEAASAIEDAYAEYSEPTEVPVREDIQPEIEAEEIVEPSTTLRQAQVKQGKHFGYPSAQAYWKAAEKARETPGHHERTSKALTEATEMIGVTATPTDTIVVRNISELKNQYPDVYRRVEKDVSESTVGFFDPGYRTAESGKIARSGSDTVVVFTDNVPTPDVATKVVLHEVVGHYGLSQMLDVMNESNIYTTLYYKTMAEVYSKHKNTPIARQIREAGYSEVSSLDKAHFAEEIIAASVRGDHVLPPTLAAKVRRAIKGVWRWILSKLKAAGIINNASVSDTEIDDIIRSTLDYMRLPAEERMKRQGFTPPKPQRTIPEIRAALETLAKEQLNGQARREIESILGDVETAEGVPAGIDGDGIEETRGAGGTTTPGVGPVQWLQDKGLTRGQAIMVLEEYTDPIPTVKHRFGSEMLPADEILQRYREYLATEASLNKNELNLAPPPLMQARLSMPARTDPVAVAESVDKAIKANFKEGDILSLGDALASIAGAETSSKMGNIRKAEVPKVEVRGTIVRGPKWLSRYLGNAEEITAESPKGRAIYEGLVKMKADTIRYSNAMKDQYEGILAKTTPEEQDAIITLLETDEDKWDSPDNLKEKAKQLRGLFDSALDALGAAGLKVEGLRERNYFTHLFEGDFVVKNTDPTDQNFARFLTEREAIAEAQRRIKAGKDAVVEEYLYIRPDLGESLDQRSFGTLIGKLYNELGAKEEDGDIVNTLTRDDIAKMLIGGKVARPKPSLRYFSSLQQRKTDNPNYSRDLLHVLDFYFYNVGRKIHQDRFMRMAQPKIEAMKKTDIRTGKRTDKAGNIIDPLIDVGGKKYTAIDEKGLAEYIENYLIPQALGRPTQFEHDIARGLRQIGLHKTLNLGRPGAMRSLFQRAALLQSVLDLGFSIPSMVANSTQYWINVQSILGPKIGVSAYKDAVNFHTVLSLKLAAARKKNPKATLRDISPEAADLADELDSFGIRYVVSSVTGTVISQQHKMERFVKGATFQKVDERTSRLRGAIEAAMMGFGAVEDVNRIGAYIGGKMKMKEHLESGGKAVDLVRGVAPKTSSLYLLAKTYDRMTDSKKKDAVQKDLEKLFGFELNETTNFRVGRENLPSLLNNWFVRTASPYKGFIVNQIKHTFKTYANAAIAANPMYKGMTPGQRKQAIKRAIIFTGTSFAVGGLYGNPALLLASTLINAALRHFGDDDRTLEERFGKIKIGNKEIKAPLRGVLAMLGADISGTTAVNLPSPARPAEWVGRYGKAVIETSKYLSGQTTRQEYLGRRSDITKVRPTGKLPRLILPAQLTRLLDSISMARTGEYVTPSKGIKIPIPNAERAAALRIFMGAMPREVTRHYELQTILTDRAKANNSRANQMKTDLEEAINEGNAKRTVGAITAYADRIKLSYSNLVREASGQNRDNDAILYWASETKFWMDKVSNTSALQNAIKRTNIPAGIYEWLQLPTWQKISPAGQEMLENANTGLE